MGRHENDEEYQRERTTEYENDRPLDHHVGELIEEPDKPEEVDTGELESGEVPGPTAG